MAAIDRTETAELEVIFDKVLKQDSVNIADHKESNEVSIFLIMHKIN